MSKRNYIPDLSIFEENIEDLVDGTAGDAYEGWAEYWTGTLREGVIAEIKLALLYWQEQCKESFSE